MANNMMEERATFSAMEHATEEDWDKVKAGKKQFNLDLPNRLITHLELLKGKHWGFPIDRFAHCLQSATLAHRAGMDEEYIACALFHDIGYSVGPRSHAEVAAAILRPYVSERNIWMVAYHQLFEGYYFFHHFGANRHAREKYRGHPCFEQTAHFCEAFDQCAFDPSFDTMPLEAFTPIINRVFSKRRARNSQRLRGEAKQSSLA